MRVYVSAGRGHACRLLWPSRCYSEDCRSAAPLCLRLDLRSRSTFRFRREHFRRFNLCVGKTDVTARRASRFILFFFSSSACLYLLVSVASCIAFPSSTAVRLLSCFELTIFWIHIREAGEMREREIADFGITEPELWITRTVNVYA